MSPREGVLHVGEDTYIPRPCVEIEATPRQFEKVLDWMYGIPLDLRDREMLQWPREGAELLELAQRLGIGALERALRRAIFEVAGRGSVELTWALLLVSHTYGLRAELEQCAAEIARAGGLLPSAELLAELPLGALGAVLRSDAWVVDREADILVLLERWLEARRLPPVAANDEEQPAAERSEGSLMPSELQRQVFSSSGGWDVRWLRLPRETVVNLATRGLVPASLVTDCDRWRKLVVHSDDKFQRAAEATHKRTRGASNEMKKQKTLKAKEVELQSAASESEKASLRFRIEEKLNRQGSEGLRETAAESQRAVNKMRVQVAVARGLASRSADVQRKLLDEETRLIEEAEAGASLGLRISDGTARWHREALAEMPVCNCESAQKILAGALHGAALRREVTGASPGARAVTESASRWIAQRLCHHLDMRLSPGAWNHIESFRTERGRATGRLNMARRRMSRSSPPIPSAELKGTRQVKGGRHALLLRLLLYEPPRISEDAPQDHGRQKTTFHRADATSGLDRVTATEQLIEAIARALHLGVAAHDGGPEAKHDEGKHDEGEHDSHEGSERPSLRVSRPGSSASSVGGQAVGRVSVSEVLHMQGVEKVVPERPPDKMLVEELTMRKALEEAWSNEPWQPGSALDLMVMLILDVESRCLKFTLDLVTDATLDSSTAFLGRFGPFERWTDDKRLGSCLQEGVVNLPKGKSFSFLLEVDSQALSRIMWAGSTAELDILPQAALKRSWWIDLMDRSVDGHPRTGAEGVQCWSAPEVD